VNAELELIATQPYVRIEFNVTGSKDCCPIYWGERSSHFNTHAGRGCPAQSWQFPAGENPEPPELQIVARGPNTARRVRRYDVTQYRALVPPAKRLPSYLIRPAACRTAAAASPRNGTRCRPAAQSQPHI
jgi:hypothetical protein